MIFEPLFNHTLVDGITIGCEQLRPQEGGDVENVVLFCLNKMSVVFGWN
jgi:hypothetical protein